MNGDLKYERANIELRRGKVLELLSKGHSQVDIAKTLNVSPGLISIDIQFLKEHVRENLRTHLQEKLPFEHSRAMTGINDLLRKANDILDKTKDPKLQLQTINVLASLYAGILTMASDGGIIEQAMKRVETLEDIKRGKFESEESIASVDSDKMSESEQEEDAANIIEESEEDIPTEQEDLKEEE
jgi:hypothetical protein